MRRPLGGYVALNGRAWSLAAAVESWKCSASSGLPYETTVYRNVVSGFSSEAAAILR